MTTSVESRDGVRIFGGGAELRASCVKPGTSGGSWGLAMRVEDDSGRSDRLRPGYFHSHTLETVLPAASTSYSKAPQVLLMRARLSEAVRKKSMPR
jgi:hypothetical protein